jgi:hypothetical protein
VTVFGKKKVESQMHELNLFIGYSHKDEDWANRTLVHLRPLQKRETYLWSDSPVKPGDGWKETLAHYIAQADIAIVLISADFLASDFIMNEEMPRLLERHQKGLVILPVIIRPCAWQMVDWLARLQVLPRDGQPLSGQKDLDQALYDMAMHIIEIGEAITAQKASDDRQVIAPSGIPSRTTMGSPQITAARQVFICHDSGDGDFADVLKSKLEKAGYEAWIDIDRLRVGEDWRAEIDDAIKRFTALVAIMTPEAKESEYVTYEWAYAAGANIKIIPLMVKLTQLHPPLESLQYLYFTNRRARPWERLIDELNIHSKSLEIGNRKQ